MAPMSCFGHVVRMIRCVTVEPVMFLFMFASSLSFSGFLAMTYDKSCLTLFNRTACEDWQRNQTAARQHGQQGDSIQHLASHWIMWGNVAVSVTATFSLLLFLGSWGDRRGRRLPVAVPCVAAMAYSLSNILNAAHMPWPLAYTLIGQVCSGLGGSYLAMLMACYTYLTHLSEAGNRMKRVGVAEAATFLSGFLSVFVSGLMVDRLGLVAAFGFALGCQTLALLYTLLLLPEVKTRDATPGNADDDERSRGDDPSTQVTCRQGAWLTPLRDMWGFVRARRSARVKVHLALFILVLSVLQLCTTGENDVLLLYLKRKPRNWSYTWYGYFKGAENFSRGAGVLVLLPLLKRFGSLRDTTLILAGLVSKSAGLVVLGLAKETWTVFLVVGIVCLQGFPSAGLRSQMAGLVLKNEQGRLFGMVAATESVVGLVSTLLFNGLYPLTLPFYDGLCFQLAAFLVFLCFLVVMYQHVELKKADQNVENLAEIPSPDAAPDTVSAQAPPSGESGPSGTLGTSPDNADVSPDVRFQKSPSTTIVKL